MPITPKRRTMLVLAISAVLAAPVLTGHARLFVPAAIWLIVVAAPLGAIVARTPATRGPLWAVLLCRLGRLVGAGLLVGGILAASMGAVGEALGLATPSVRPSISRVALVARTAMESGAAGVMWGLMMGVVVFLFALPEALWARRRATVIAPDLPPSRTGVFGVILPVLGFVAACEIVLTKENFITGCSSACSAYSLSLGSRALGVALALTAMLGTAHMIAAARPNTPRRALGACALAMASVLSLLASHATYSTDLRGGFHRGWLFVHMDDIPGEGALRGARVESQHDGFGRTLVVRLRSGEVTRWRLSLGPVSLRGADQLVAFIEAETKDP